mmetsp:Transcript_44650/g.112526  ORF Transcript_44650/g.112526 Transcript_44650/m.112526 type:complete len:213 (+) Transcript_44650:379-1017(+)|eukprot:CAMPEP_0177650114 /NCGR_PEP_ID=MMETSP0447-20121125/11756_1 /TAXON_ID=0 /ORGANISM="Stygamoeba regulata, Strain BSH-02190019" /LENGTH=212 /DNA_ID=CAMNT_0019152935 /DNA_START=348 /DNA_END=986 /DNA_ORIENTATION=-
MPPKNEFAGELNNLDFDKLLLSPVMSAMDAQFKTSAMTVEFMNDYCFSRRTGQAGGELSMMEMKFTKYSKDGKTKTPMSVKVPLLCLFKIPAIRIRQLTTNFSINMTSTMTRAAGLSASIQAEAEIQVTLRYKIFAVTVIVGAQLALSFDTKSGQKSTRTYTMECNATFAAPQNNGMDTLLELLGRATNERVEKEATKQIEAKKAKEEEAQQ